MVFEKAKIYNDGSHYIGIPRTTRPSVKREKQHDEIIEVKIETPANSDESLEQERANATSKIIEKSVNKPIIGQNATKKLTKKEYFNELYKQTLNMKASERNSYLIKNLKPYFNSLEETKSFVYRNLHRKKRNKIARSIRIFRKANLCEFNYFVTFTYDDNKHTEVSFRKVLQNCLKKLVSRKRWKYLGVWERSPEKNRLHFHGLFQIPENEMVGELVKVKDYNFKSKKMKLTIQNTYFNERFGRSDFEPISSKQEKEDAVKYIIKYLEKTEERVVCSRNVKQFIVSDIFEDDIACPMGEYNEKFVLFDNFTCIHDGEIIGEVCQEVIDKMPKAN